MLVFACTALAQESVAPAPPQQQQPTPHTGVASDSVTAQPVHTGVAVDSVTAQPVHAGVAGDSVIAQLVHTAVARYSVTEQPLMDETKDPGRQWGTLASPDGCHLVLGFLPEPKDSRGKYSCYLVIDGVKTPVYEDIARDHIVFGADSRHVAYPVRQNGKWKVVVDGTSPLFQSSVGPDCDGIMASSLKFSDDGRHVMYIAKVGEVSRLFVDHQPKTGCDGCIEAALSGGAGRYACWVKSGAGLKLIVEGDSVAWWPKTFPGVLRFAPGGRTWGYVGIRGDSCFAMLEHQTVAIGSDATGPVFSGDGGKAAFVVKQGAHWVVIADGHADEPGFDRIGRGPFFNADGSRLLYRGRIDKDKTQFVVDSTRGPVYDGGEDPVFSRGGHHYGYLAVRGKKWLAVLDGHEGQEYDEMASGSIAFNSDGTRSAYVAAVGKQWQVILDGTPGPVLESIFEGRVRLSDDGLHHAWFAREAGRWVPVLDGQAAAERYETIVRNGPRCWEDGTIEFLAWRNGKLYRVRYQPTASSQ